MERASEIFALERFDHAKKSLENAGDRIVNHSRRVSSKNLLSRFISRSDDNYRKDLLSLNLEKSVSEFEDAAKSVDTLKAIKDLTLEQFKEPSGYGVSWFMNEIHGKFQGQDIQIYHLSSSDWSSEGMWRVTRWTETRGRINGVLLSEEEAKQIHDRLIYSLVRRNDSEKIGIKSFPGFIDHSEYFERAYEYGARK